jgi:hypothetical protein
MSMGTNHVQSNFTRAATEEPKTTPGAGMIGPAIEGAADKHENQHLEGPYLSPRKSDTSKAVHGCLQESFEKELSRVKKTAEYNDTSSLFSNNTDNDSTIKFISILDKINENQIKKNKFYSEIIKDIDLEHHHHNSQISHFQSKHKEDYLEFPSFDESTKGVTKSARNQFPSREHGNDDSHYGDRDRLYLEKVKGAKAGEVRASNNGNQIEHILEVHQPNQHEIIFECSKEWTVNQTPDMREKELIPAHLAAHFERLRQSALNENFESSPPSKNLGEECAAPSRIYRLNCQKELFQMSPSDVDCSRPPA